MRVSAPSRPASAIPAAPGRKSRDGLYIPEFTIAVDDREGAPWTFTGLTGGAKQDYRPLLARTQVVHLETGDYSIVGLEDEIAIERKSLEDLYGSLCNNKSDDRRDRFKAEHGRMWEIMSRGGYAAVIVESSLEDALLNPPISSGLNPRVVNSTRISWSVRFGVPWFWEPGRGMAEACAFRLLEYFWLNKYVLHNKD